MVVNWEDPAGSKLPPPYFSSSFGSSTSPCLSPKPTAKSKYKSKTLLNRAYSILAVWKTSYFSLYRTEFIRLGNKFRAEKWPNLTWIDSDNFDSKIYIIRFDVTKNFESKFAKWDQNSFDSYISSRHYNFDSEQSINFILNHFRLDCTLNFISQVKIVRFRLRIVYRYDYELGLFKHLSKTISFNLSARWVARISLICPNSIVFQKLRLLLQYYIYTYY